MTSPVVKGDGYTVNKKNLETSKLVERINVLESKNKQLQESVLKLRKKLKDVKKETTPKKDLLQAVNGALKQHRDDIYNNAKEDRQAILTLQKRVDSIVKVLKSVE